MVVITLTYQAGQCWWCGAPSDSREHRHKASDVRREFGTGPYRGDDEVVRGVSGETLRTVQGPKSEQLKFEATLCQACNGARSQPFDHAYEAFTGYLRNNEHTIWRTREVRLSAVFGAAGRTSAEDLLRWYAKHIGCRLAERGLDPPAELRAYLDGTPVRGLAFRFSIQRDIVALMRDYERRGEALPNLWLGKMIEETSCGAGAVHAVVSHHGYRWFRATWRCDPTIRTQGALFPQGIVPLEDAHRLRAALLRFTFAAERRPHLRPLGRLVDRLDHGLSEASE